jgi:hypothetical protein
MTPPASDAGERAAELRTSEADSPAAGAGAAGRIPGFAPGARKRNVIVLLGYLLAALVALAAGRTLLRLLITF